MDHNETRRIMNYSMDHKETRKIFKNAVEKENGWWQSATCLKN